MYAYNVAGRATLNNEVLMNLQQNFSLHFSICISCLLRLENGAGVALVVDKSNYFCSCNVARSLSEVQGLDYLNRKLSAEKCPLLLVVTQKYIAIMANTAKSA